RPPPWSTPFPYTTLFRSDRLVEAGEVTFGDRDPDQGGEDALRCRLDVRAGARTRAVEVRLPHELAVPRHEQAAQSRHACRTVECLLEESAVETDRRCAGSGHVGHGLPICTRGSIAARIAATGEQHKRGGERSTCTRNRPEQYAPRCADEPASA